MILYVAAAAGIVAAILVLSAFLGQRHHERATDEPYESGVEATGTSHVRFDVKFYLVAMFFLIFDLEAVFLYAWAVSVKESGWTGYGEVLIFTAVLAAGLVYLWKRGALEWGKSGQGQGDKSRQEATGVDTNRRKTGHREPKTENRELRTEN